MRSKSLKQAAGFVLCLTLSWSSPALALRQTGLEESNQREGLAAALKSGLASAPVRPNIPMEQRLSPPGIAAGTEELQIAALPIEHAIDYRLPGRFLSGRAPSSGAAVKLLKSGNISHPQLATQWIGVVSVFEDLLGSGRGLGDVEKKTAVDRADLRAQEVQNLVAKARNRRLEHVNFETKGLTPGGLQAGAKGGAPKGTSTPTISDVVEHTTAFVLGEPGASSMQLEGPGAETFGSFPDQARALMVATHIDVELEKEVLRRHGAKTVDDFLDPELPVDQLVRRVSQLNGAHLDKMDVTILTSDDADMQALGLIQQTYQGMRIYRIKAGTVAPSIASVLGVNDGRVRLFVRRSGVTEAVYMTALAGVFGSDGSYANFRVVSEQIKSEFSRRYDWSQAVLAQLKVLRPGDWEQIRDGKLIFSSRQVTKPVSGAYTFLTDGRTDIGLPFHVKGVRQNEGVSRVYSLVFVSNPKKKEGGFLWGSLDGYRIPAVTNAGAEESARPVSLDKYKEPPKTSVFRFTRQVNDTFGEPVWSNVFFHDGLWSDAKGMYLSLEEHGAAGTTTNQSIIEKKHTEWKELVRGFWQEGLTPRQAFLRAYHREAKVPYTAFRSLREWSGHDLGQVSVEASANETTYQGVLNDTRLIDQLFAGESTLVKVPNVQGPSTGVPNLDEDGPKVTRQRVREGLSGNITLGFSVQHYLAHAHAYIYGLRDRAQDLKDQGYSRTEVQQDLTRRVRWVFSLFMSRIDRKVAPWIDEEIKRAEAEGRAEDAAELKLLRGKTAVATGRFTGQVTQYIFGMTDEPLQDHGFLSLEERIMVQDLRQQFFFLRRNYSARPLYLLIASSGKYADQDYATELQYVLPFLGSGMWNTLPPATLKALSDYVAKNPTWPEIYGNKLNLIQEEIPWVPQPVEQWDGYVTMSTSQLDQYGVAHKPAAWILKETERLVLGSGRFAQKSLAEVGDERRNAGAADFKKAEDKILAQIDAWYKEFEREGPAVKLLADLTELNRWWNLHIIGKAKSGHPGGTLSSAEIMTVLFNGVLNLNPADAAWDARDRFVLSKGHAAPMAYAGLANAGFLKHDQLPELRQKRTGPLQGHMDSRYTPGVEVSTGALGYGVQVAAGKAAALKVKGVNAHVFSLMGDGEIQGGGVWEMFQKAPSQGLDNFTGILDWNQFQQDAPVAEHSPYTADSLAASLRGWGWDVTVVEAGPEKNRHGWTSAESNLAYLTRLRRTLLETKEQKNGKPKMVIVKTVKGRGVDSTEKAYASGNLDYHGKPLTAEMYEQATREIAVRLSIPDAATLPLVELEAALKEKTAALMKEQESLRLTGEQIKKLTEQNVKSMAQARELKSQKAPVPAKEYKAGESVATRTAFGNMLAHLATRKDPIDLGDGIQLDPLSIVGVDMSDLGNSTMLDDLIKAVGVFGASNPAGRYFRIGIREMYGAHFAEGLASEGLLPVPASFESFWQIAMRMPPHARQMGYPLILGLTHSGTQPGEDGPGNTGSFTTAMLKAAGIPVIEPADARSTPQALLRAMAVAIKENTPVALRMHRNAWANLPDAPAEGSFAVLRDPSAGTRSIDLVVAGATVPEAVKASEALEQQGINARVIAVQEVTAIGSQDKAFRDTLQPGRPVYVVTDAPPKVAGGAVQDAVNSRMWDIKGNSTPTPPIRVLARGIDPSQEGSAPGPVLFKEFKFDAAGITADVPEILKAVETGDLDLLPAGVLPPSHLNAGLEEPAATAVATAVRAAPFRGEFTPSRVELDEAHIFDPENADVGRVVAQVIGADPVVIIARDAVHERAILDSGFGGLGRSVLRLDLYGSITDARADAARNLSGFSPRFYRADQRQNLLVWLVSLVERYSLTQWGLSAEGLREMVDSVGSLRSAA